MGESGVMEPTRDQRNALRAELRHRFERDRGQLLPALHYVHHEFGHLPGWAMELTGWHLGIPVSEVYGAATSYSELRIEPPGRHLVRVCTGLGCISAGARGLLSSITERLGEAPQNGGVTVEETACGYLCGLAPAVQVDGAWVGRADAGEVLARLKDADE
jgi:NADH:ubiquinone oxidoreductase subunit E